MPFSRSICLASFSTEERFASREPVCDAGWRTVVGYLILHPSEGTESSINLIGRNDSWLCLCPRQGVSKVAWTRHYSIFGPPHLR